MDFHNVPYLSDSGVFGNSQKMGKECGMHGVNVILSRFLIGNWEGRFLSKGLCEYVRYHIEMDFKELYEDGF